MPAGEKTLDRYRQQFRRAHRKIAGYAEHRIVSTPALDALDARGSRLTAAYAIADLRSGLRQPREQGGGSVLLIGVKVVGRILSAYSWRNTRQIPGTNDALIFDVRMLGDTRRAGRINNAPFRGATLA